jgi:hypothetical protein
VRWAGEGRRLWSVRVDLIAPDGDGSRVAIAHESLLGLLVHDDGVGGHPGSGIDQGIGHEGRPVIGFTFYVRADDVGSAATTGLAVAEAAGPAAGVGPEFYDVVVVPHSAIVVPLDEFEIPRPD